MDRRNAAGHLWCNFHDCTVDEGIIGGFVMAPVQSVSGGCRQQSEGDDGSDDAYPLAPTAVVFPRLGLRGRLGLPHDFQAVAGDCAFDRRWSVDDRRHDPVLRMRLPRRGCLRLPAPSAPREKRTMWSLMCSTWSSPGGSMP